MNKKIYIIGGVVLIVLIGAVIAILSLKNGRSELASKNTTSTTPTDSDFVGKGGDCEPLDGNQWYRSDNTLTINPVNPNNLGIFIERRGYFRTENGGSSWEYSSKGIKGHEPTQPSPHNRPCYLEFSTAAVDPSNPNRILLGALGDFNDITSAINKAGGLLESIDGGKTWKQLLKPGINAYVHAIAISPADPKTIYYTTSSYYGNGMTKSLLTKGLVYKTIDGGENWEELNTGILPNTGGQEIYIDGKNPNRVLVTTATFNYVNGQRQPANEVLGVLISEDAGENWTSYKSLPEGDEAIISSSVAPNNFNNLYVSVMSDTEARGYYSTNSGKTFSKSGMAMDVVAFDPTDLTGNRAVGYAWQIGAKTLFETSDAGATWRATGTLPAEITSVQDPKQRISKIVIDPSDSNIMYAAGSNAFVWKTIDGGKKWVMQLSLDTLP